MARENKIVRAQALLKRQLEILDVKDGFGIQSRDQTYQVFLESHVLFSQNKKRFLLTESQLGVSRQIIKLNSEYQASERSISGKHSQSNLRQLQVLIPSI
jgi:hypothetical protein